MLNLEELKLEPFEFSFKDENGENIRLDISEMSMRKVREIEKISLSTNEDILNALTIILNENNSGKEFTKERAEELFSISEAKFIIIEYYKWLLTVRKSPN